MESPRWDVYGLLYAIVIVVTFLMFALSIPVGTYTVFFTKISSAGYTTQSTVSYLPIYAGVLPLDIPVTPSFGELFLGLTAIYVAMIALAFVQGGGFVRALVSAATEGPKALFRNPLSATIVLLGAALLATVLLQLAQTAVGIGTGGLSGDPLLLLMDFTLSPLIEEIGYRFFLIGVPLAILLLVARPSLGRFLGTLWRPSSAWDAASSAEPEQAQLNERTLRNFTYFLIGFSSILFGLAHYLSGAGWEVGKISEAALDGVALAYLYVRYGLHASIVFHWAVDYASNVFAFYGQGVFGISWTTASNFSNIPSYLILIFVGVPGLVYVLNIILKRAISPAGQSGGDDSSRPLNPDTAGGTVQGYLTDDP